MSNNRDYQIDELGYVGCEAEFSHAIYGTHEATHEAALKYAAQLPGDWDLMSTAHGYRLEWAEPVDVCSHENVEHLTGQATLSTFGPGRRPNSGTVDLCLECGRRFETN